MRFVRANMVLSRIAEWRNGRTEQAERDVCMSVHKDCFAYNDDNGQPGCAALNKLYCAKEACSFYKTEQEAREGRTKAEERLERLRGRQRGKS